MLLLTNLTNSELVLGKLLASLLNVLVLLAASLPLFMLSRAVRRRGVCANRPRVCRHLATAVAAGSIGSLVALWREKTFQTLALTVLVLVFWLAAGEAVAVGRFRGPVAGRACRACGPPRSVPGRQSSLATRPLIDVQDALPSFGNAINLFLLVACGAGRGR